MKNINFTNLFTYLVIFAMEIIILGIIFLALSSCSARQVNSQKKTAETSQISKEIQKANESVAETKTSQETVFSTIENQSFKLMNELANNFTIEGAEGTILVTKNDGTNYQIPSGKDTKITSSDFSKLEQENDYLLSSAEYLKEENEKLISENSNLKTQNLTLKTQLAENQKLTERTSTDYKPVLALALIICYAIYLLYKGIKMRK